MELTKEQQLKNLETLQDMFQHQGWELFIEEFDSFDKYLKEQAYIECDLNDQWQQRRGTLALLDRILTYQQTIEMVHENLVNEPEAE